MVVVLLYTATNSTYLTDRFRIDKLFRENNISIPFPQRDIHFYPTSKES